MMQLNPNLVGLLFSERPALDLGISAIVLDQGPGPGVETGLVLYCDEEFLDCRVARFTFQPGGTRQPPPGHPPNEPWHAPRIPPSIRLWDMRGNLTYREAMRRVGTFANSQANEYY